MKNIRVLLLALLFGLAGAGMYACPNSDVNDGPAEQAGEQIDDAAEDVGDKMEDVGDKIEDVADQAEDSVDSAN